MPYIFTPTGDLVTDLTKIYTDAGSTAKPMTEADLGTAEAAAILAGVSAEGMVFEDTPANIKMNGVQAVGALATVARGDHIHPSDTSKLAGNTAITGATKTKITYDAKGLVTGGADATTADIADSTNRRYMTDVQKTKLDGLYSQSMNFLTNGTSSIAITTDQFVAYIITLGALNKPYWVARGSWSYANNDWINDTGCGNIHLAGCVIKVYGHVAAYTIKIITPTTTTQGTVNAEFIYVFNGAGYSPGWRVISNSNTGDETTATIKSKLGITTLSGSNTGDQTNITGNAETVTNGIYTGNVAETATASKIAKRDASADINVRLLRSNYADQATISGGLVFRVNNSADNYHRVCNDVSAIRTFLGVAASVIASSAEAIAGTDDTKIITPLKLRNGLNASGSAPIYACRAWVNFDGTSAGGVGSNKTIRGSGNVSSVIDNGVSNYTVNFTTGMVDSNYSACISGVGVLGTNNQWVGSVELVSQTSSALHIAQSSTSTDTPLVCVAIFR